MDSLDLQREKIREPRWLALRDVIGGEVGEELVDFFNSWFAMGNLISSIREFSENGGKDAEDIIKFIRTLAPEAIKATAKKIVVFKKESGSFSYGVKTSAPRSQGMPVALEGSAEGDINGHILSSTGLLQHIYRGLDLVEYKVPLFTRCDFDRYMNLLKEKRKDFGVI